MILILGCGFLGTYLLRRLKEKTDEPILFTSRSPIQPVSGAEWMPYDVTNAADLSGLAARCRNQRLTVFYFAACHNIDFIFENPTDAARVNLEGLSAFLSAVPGIEKLFFASTDCVYGENTPAYPRFSETDPLHPVNEYGRQKAAAEDIIRAAGFTAVRFSYMLGPSLTAKTHFYDKVLAALKEGKPVEMIDGMRRSVLSYQDAAEFLCRLASLPRTLLPEMVNVCGDEGLTKYEMGLRLAKVVGAAPSLIVKISEAEGKKFFKDARASSAVMDNTLLKSLLAIDRIRWDPTK